MFKKKLNIKFYNMEDEKKIEKKVKSPRESSLILKKISELLTDICEENKKETNLFYKPLKSFYSMNIPLISIKDYLEQLYKYTKIDSSTIVLILIYIDRICNIYKCKLSYYNIHKLILGALVVASKYNEDCSYTLKYYSKIGGVSQAEIFNLEYNFLALIQFKLFVTEELFCKYNDYLLSSDSDDDSDNWDFDDDNNINNDIKKNKDFFG